MRFFETTPLKVLLLPLLPAAALGVVMLTTQMSEAPPGITAPEIRCGYGAVLPSPPPPPLPPAPCTSCGMAAPA